MSWYKTLYGVARMGKQAFDNATQPAPRQPPPGLDGPMRPRSELNGQRLRSEGGTIYLVDDGLKRPVKDLNTLRRLFNGSSESRLDTDQITTGTEIGDQHLLIKGDRNDTYYLTDEDERGQLVIRPMDGATHTKYDFAMAVNVVPQVLIDQLKVGKSLG